MLDLDGTLTDSRPGIIASLTAALRALGHEPDPAADLRQAVGPPLPDVMADLLRPYGDARVPAGIAAYRAHYRSFGLFDHAIYAGIEDLLIDARTHGLRLRVATSKQTALARHMLEHAGLARLFDGIHGAEPGGALDRKPALIAHILERAGIARAAAVMVGDRHYDIEGGRANGLRTIGVLWGYGGRAELEQAGADALAESPGHLRELLGMPPELRAG